MNTFIDEFASNFVRHEMLRENFNKRKPVGPATDKVFWFERQYDSIPGSMSANDVLREFLIQNGYEYLNHLGVVWFLYQGNWHSCENRVEDGFMRFYMLEFDLG